MSFHRLAAVTAFSLAALASASGFAQTATSASSFKSFPVQLMETKAIARAFNSATLDRTERYEVDTYIAQAASLYDRGSETQAKAFLDVARVRLHLPIIPADMRVALSAKDPPLSGASAGGTTPSGSSDGGKTMYCPWSRC